MWDGLNEEWGLSDEVQHLMDLREGVVCAFCRANARSMHLAATLLDDIGATIGERYATIRDLARSGSPPRIAEINKIPGLHEKLGAVVTYSEYGGENSQDLMALTYRDETFDYVLTSDTLEHVPDFDKAMSETRRVLKTDGKHIFTIPVLWDRETRRRASIVDGELVHHEPPSYHGSSAGEDYLVINEFGSDVLPRIEDAGFHVTVRRDAQNEFVCTIVATKR